MLLHDLRRSGYHLIIIQRGVDPRGHLVGKRCAHVHGDQHVARLTANAVQRKRIDRTAVHQYHIAPADGPENRRDRNRSPDGVVQSAPVEHDLAPGQQVGRHGRKRQRHLFDLHVGHQLLHGADHAVPLHKTFGTQRKIDQTENLVFIERVHPLLECFEVSRSIHAADQRPHRSSCHGMHFESLTLQLLDSPDVGHSTRSAAGQHQRRSSFFHKINCRY